MTREESRDELRIVARPVPWAWVSPFVIALLFFAFARVVYLAAHDRPDQWGAVYFMWLLLTLGVGAILVGIQTLRSQIVLSIQREQAIVEHVGLFRSQVVWTLDPTETYFLVVASRHIATSHGNHRRHTRVDSLVVLDSKGDVCQRLIADIQGRQAIRAMAHSISERYFLPPPGLVYLESGQNEELAYREAQQRHYETDRDQALDEMKRSVAEMEQARDQIERAREHLQSQVDTDDAKQVGQDELLEVESGIETAKAEILRAEVDVCMQNCGMYEFASFHLGNSVQYNRIELESDASEANRPPTQGVLSLVGHILSLPGTVGASLLIFIITPMVVPLSGQLILWSLNLLPRSVARIQAHLAIADLFALDLKIFWWSPILIAIYVLWTVLKVDASLAPLRVHFDWSKRNLRIQRRTTMQDVSFDAIESLSMAVVHQSKKISTEQRDKVEWDNHAALFVETGGSRIAILELVSSSRSRADWNDTLDRFDPLATKLARSLHVPLAREGISIRKSKYDAVGFPFSWRALHMGRIFRLANAKVRRMALISLLMIGGCLAALFLVRFNQNRQEAEDYFSSRSHYPTSSRTELSLVCSRSLFASKRSDSQSTASIPSTP